MPPEEFAAAMSAGDTPTLFAVMTWSVPKRAFAEVSEPVRKTPGQPKTMPKNGKGCRQSR